MKHQGSKGQLPQRICLRLLTGLVLVLVISGSIYVLLQSPLDIRISICASSSSAKTETVCNKTRSPTDSRSGLSVDHKDIMKDIIDVKMLPSGNIPPMSHGLPKDRHVDIHKANTRNTYCERRLPSCVIIGIQKCGTTALSEFLRIHPDIAIDSRQIYYFSQNYGRGADWYRGQMPCSRPGQVTMERTPQYFFVSDVPERIKQMKSNMKLILIVRDPVKRTISNFAMSQYRLREHKNNSFESCVLENNNGTCTVNYNSKYIRKSTYHIFLNRWLQLFPLKQILILDGDRFIVDPVSQLKVVEDFLGVRRYIEREHFAFNGQSGFNCVRGSHTEELLRCLPKSKGRIHPYVNDNVIKVLKDYFQPHNEIFYEMTKQRFDW